MRAFVTRVIADSLFSGPDTRPKYLDIPKSWYSSMPYDKVVIGDRVVGLSAYAGYTANLRSWVSLAMVDEGDAADGCQPAGHGDGEQQERGQRLGVERRVDVVDR